MSAEIKRLRDINKRLLENSKLFKEYLHWLRDMNYKGIKTGIATPRIERHIDNTQAAIAAAEGE